jgi:hypothetical protein
MNGILLSSMSMWMDFIRLCIDITTLHWKRFWNITITMNKCQQPAAVKIMKCWNGQNAVSSRKNRNRINLPKSFLQFLADPNNGFETMTSKVAKLLTSEDGSTTKIAIQLHDGQLVESVLMRYGPNNKSKSKTEGNNRVSLCVSSQVGCAMACSFCATGMMGLTGDLHYAEILEQVIHAERILAVEALQRRTPLHMQVHQQNPDESATSIKTKNKPGSDLDVVRNIGKHHTLFGTAIASTMLVERKDTEGRIV